MDFILKLEENFDVPYTFTPMLVLIEYNKKLKGGSKSLREARKILLDLEGINRSGQLFQEIFRIAKEHVVIDDFSNGLTATYIKGNIFDLLIGVIERNSQEIRTHLRNIRRFRII